MKNKIMLFLPLFVESCSDALAGNINTGSYKECLEGVTTRLFVATAAFRFTDLDDFKTEASWKTAIAAKSIVPLYNVYEVASANTEATKFETGNFVYTTKKEVKKMTSESYLSVCSHAQLKKVETSAYTQIFEITERGEILGVYDTDGVKIKGQDITDFDVAIRERPTTEKPAYSMVTITYRDYEEFEDRGVVVKPSWDANTLYGVFDIQLQILSASATEITFRASSGCGSTDYASLTDAMMELLDASGDAQTIDSLTYLNGVYTLGGTGLVSGTLGTIGIQTVNDMAIEAVAVPVVIV